jgi:hypothetical protein
VVGHRLQPKPELLNQQGEADEELSAHYDTVRQSQPTSHATQYYGRTSQNPTQQSAPPPAQQISSHQAVGVQLLERLGTMPTQSQPIHTTGVTNRIPQPDQLRRAKKGKGPANKPTTAATLKPVQTGLPVNGSRVSSINPFFEESILCTD